MYFCIYYMCIRVHLQVCLHAYVYISKYLCTCTCSHLYKYTHTSTHTYTRIEPAPMHPYMRIYKHTYLHTCMYIWNSAISQWRFVPTALLVQTLHKQALSIRNPALLQLLLQSQVRPIWYVKVHVDLRYDQFGMVKYKLISCDIFFKWVLVSIYLYAKVPALLQS